MNIKTIPVALLLAATFTGLIANTPGETAYLKEVYRLRWAAKVDSRLPYTPQTNLDSLLNMSCESLDDLLTEDHKQIYQNIISCMKVGAAVFGPYRNKDESIPLKLFRKHTEFCSSDKGLLKRISLTREALEIKRCNQECKN